MSNTAVINTNLTTLHQKLIAALCRPGDAVQTIDNKLARACGDYPAWRLRAIRLGQAGCFSAAAYVAFIEKAQQVLDKHARASRAADLTQAVKLDAAAAALEHLDAEFHRFEIDRLRLLARELRTVSQDRSLADSLTDPTRR